MITVLPFDFSMSSFNRQLAVYFGFIFEVFALSKINFIKSKNHQLIKAMDLYLK